MQAERIGSHFSHNGPINLISRPNCYICKDASVDTHIDATYFRHLSSLKSDIRHNLQMSAMTLDSDPRLYVYFAALPDKCKKLTLTNKLVR